MKMASSFDLTNSNSIPVATSNGNPTGIPVGTNNLLDSISQYPPFDWQDDEHLQRDLEYWDLPHSPQTIFNITSNRNNYDVLSSLNPVSGRGVLNPTNVNKLMLPSLIHSNRFSNDTLSSQTSYLPSTSSRSSTSFGRIHSTEGTKDHHSRGSPSSHDSSRPHSAELHSPMTNIYNTQRSTTSSSGNTTSSPTNYGIPMPQHFLTNHELERVFTKDELSSSDHRNISSSSSSSSYSSSSYFPPITRSKTSGVSNWTNSDPVATVSPKTPPDHHQSSFYDDISFIRDQVSNRNHHHNSSYDPANSDQDDYNTWLHYDHNKVWTVQEVDTIIRNQTNPIGKFFRDMKITAKEVIDTGMMKDLVGAPTKPRKKYGPRRQLTEDERLEITKQRNREHAKATRIRKRLFKLVLENRSALKSVSSIRSLNR